MRPCKYLVNDLQSRLKNSGDLNNLEIDCAAKKMRKPRRVLGEGFAFCNVFPVIMMTMEKSAEWHI